MAGSVSIPEVQMSTCSQEGALPMWRHSWRLQVELARGWLRGEPMERSHVAFVCFCGLSWEGPLQQCNKHSKSTVTSSEKKSFECRHFRPSTHSYTSLCAHFPSHYFRFLKYFIWFRVLFLDPGNSWWWPFHSGSAICRVLADVLHFWRKRNASGLERYATSLHTYVTKWKV